MKAIDKLLAPIKKLSMNALVANSRWLDSQVKKYNILYTKAANNYKSNIKKIENAAVLSYKRELAINEILKSGEYDFDNILVIKNPYEIAPMSALALFVTDKPCKVRYTVAGKRGSEDFTKCDENITRYHRVPMLGMYESTINTVTINLIDEENNIIASKKIRIIIRGLGKIVRNGMKLTNSKQPLSKDFIFVSGGYHGGVYAFDKKGNIRFALNKIPQYCGVYLFKDGRFLFPEKHMRRPAWGNANTVVMHEMDMMGRVYRTYYDKKGLHHWAIEKEPDGNILALSSSIDDTYMENEIVEIDRMTGEIVKEINMNHLLVEKYITRNDWAHINSIEYIKEDDSVIISMRNVHTIAKISLKDESIVWLLTKPKFYKNTDVEDKVLKPKGDIKWFFQQHAIQIVHGKEKDGKLHVMLFDNHTANRRPVKWFDKEKKSNIMFFAIDEKEMTVMQEQYLPIPLSVTRSNEEYDAETGKVLAMCANLKPPIDDYNGKIYEIDYNSGEILNEFSSKLDYFSAHSVEFNIADMAKPLDLSNDMIVGELCEPVREDTNSEQFKNMLSFIDDIEDGDDKPQLCMYGELLQIRALDHMLEKIYLYNDKDTYIQDFTDTEQPLEVFGTQHYFMSMPLMKVKHGEYNVAIQFKGNIYDTQKYISVF